MDLKVNVDQEEINKHLIQVVLDSSVGNAIKRGIERQINDLVKSYGGPIENSIKEVISEVVREEVLKHKDQIKKVVASQLTEKHIKDIVAKLDKVIERAY